MENPADSQSHKSYTKSLAIIMRNITYILFALVLISCQKQNKGSKKTIIPDSTSTVERNANKMNVLFSAYVTEEKGLNYRKEPNINSNILGKFKYGTKVDIIDDSNRLSFWVDDSVRASLNGKWIGIRKDSTIVYAFDAYIYKFSPNIEEHIKLVNEKLEVVYSDSLNINSNQKLIIEKHIQTSNHLADYVIIKLIEDKRTIFNHKIDHLLKEYYTLTKIKDTVPTYDYLTIFDESPSSKYKQTFSIIQNKILKVKESYQEADEIENND